MIRAFQFPDGRFGFTFFGDNVYDNFFLLIKSFEEKFTPIEKITISGWHDVIYEYQLDHLNNKIRVECSDEIVTIMFTEDSDDASKQFLKTIAETMDDELLLGR